MFPGGGHLGYRVELSNIIFEGDHPTTQHFGKYTQHNEVVSTYHNPVVTLHSVVLAQRKKLLSSSNEIST